MHKFRNSPVFCIYISYIIFFPFIFKKIIFLFPFYITKKLTAVQTEEKYNIQTISVCMICWILNKKEEEEGKEEGKEEETGIVNPNF